MSGLYLVRHGENHANVLQVFSCKHVDYPLTAKGVRQARRTGASLAQRSIARVYSSPLKRALQTAEIIADQVGLSVEVVEGLIEVDVGDLEGQAIDEESRAFYDAVLEDWLTGQAEAAFPNGEDAVSFYTRAESALAPIIAGNPGGGKVIVGHEGFFKAASKLLCPELDPHVVLDHPYPKGAISEIEVALRDGARVGVLRSWGEDGHLLGDGTKGQ